MKKLHFIGIILSLAVLLTSCASSAKNSAQSMSSATASYEKTADNIEGDFAGDEAKESNAPPTVFYSTARNPNDAVSQITNRKIIKNANIDIEAKNVSDCYKKLLDYAVSQGGYEISKNMSNSSDYDNLNAAIKIPPDKLDTVLEFAQECGNVVNMITSTDDITAQYTDTEIRLKNKKKNLEKYYEFYSKATTIEEMVTIQTQIDNITADIEAYEGQIKLWNSQLDESTITIYIQEASDPNKIPKDIEWNSISLATMGKIIQNGFMAVINVTVSFFQWLIIIILSISPLIVIAGIVLFIILKFNKKKKNKLLPETKSQNPDNK